MFGLDFLKISPNNVIQLILKSEIKAYFFIDLDEFCRLTVDFFIVPIDGTAFQWK